MGNSCGVGRDGKVSPIPGAIITEKSFLGLIEEKQIKEEILGKNTYRQTIDMNEGIHLPAADETANKWAQKSHIRRDSYHSVRSSPSLTSLKNELVAMHEEIHNKPIIITQTYKGPDAFTLPPIFDPGEKRDQRIQIPTEGVGKSCLASKNLPIIGTEKNFTARRDSKSMQPPELQISRQPSAGAESSISQPKIFQTQVLHHRDTIANQASMQKAGNIEGAPISTGVNNQYQESVDYNKKKYDRTAMPGNLVRHTTEIDIDPNTGKGLEPLDLQQAKLSRAEKEDGTDSIDEGIDVARGPHTPEKIKQIDELEKNREENGGNVEKSTNKAVGMETSASNYSNVDGGPGGDQAMEEIDNANGVLVSTVPKRTLKTLAKNISALENPDIPPWKPSDAVVRFADVMTEFEKSECMNFPEIYFAGTKEVEKVQGTIDDPHQNNGYDDPDGIYYQLIGDHLSYRYEITAELGAGAFGSVVKCKDYKTNTHVALKIIRNKKRFHQQALMEVKILNILKAKDKKSKLNVIHIVDYFYFRNHLCISFELLGMNLYELIKKNNFHGFSLNVVRRIAIAMLKCLYALADEKLIHCDLKPENILIYPKGQGGQNGIKIIDFGASCYEHERVYTYIQSRFYRAPEVILGASYGMPIDMWSFACILIELYNGLPIFPGENEHEQIACFLEVLGKPSMALLDRSQRKRIFFDSQGEPRQMQNSRGKKRRVNGRSMAQATGSEDPVFLDFIKRSFEWDPEERLTPIQAIRHDWIRRRNPNKNNDVDASGAIGQE